MMCDDQYGLGSAKQMESLLSCPICLDIYTKPVVILPCQHNLCRKCAEDCFEQRGTRFGISGGRFKCPTCRYEVILDRHGTFGLPRNLLVENIIDMMEQDQKKKDSEIVERIEQQEQKQQEQINLKITEEFIKAKKLCADHKETLKVYCLSCQKLICATCKVFGECQTCTVVRAEQAYEQQQAEIREAVRLITGSTDRVQSAVSHCQDLKSRTEAIDCESRQLIINQFDKIFTALEQKKQHLLGKISNVTNDVKNTITIHENKFSEALSNANSDVSDGLLLTDQKDHIEFLQTARELIDSMMKHQCDMEARPPPIQPPNPSKWRIDLNPLVEIIKKIDFTSDIRFKQTTPNTSAPLKKTPSSGCIQEETQLNEDDHSEHKDIEKLSMSFDETNLDSKFFQKSMSLVTSPQAGFKRGSLCIPAAVSPGSSHKTNVTPLERLGMILNVVPSSSSKSKSKNSAAAVNSKSNTSLTDTVGNQNPED